MTSIQITKKFRFESAHVLPKVSDGHQCGRLHGHSYELEVTVAGSLDEELGWVMDFADISDAVKPLVEELDHRLLNEITGLENPTCEIMVGWIAARLAKSLPGLTSVKVSETPSSSCTLILD